MKLIVDYVAFEGKGDPVLKELALVSLDGKRSAHIILKAPYPWSALDSESKVTYKNQIQERHGICWDEGGVAYLELADQLKRMTSRAIALYALGADKCRVLSKICGRTFIDMESEFGAVDADSIASVGVSCLQPCHGLPKMHCALRNADRLRQWLEYYDHRTRIANFCYRAVKNAGTSEIADAPECACLQKV